MKALKLVLYFITLLSLPSCDSGDGGAPAVSETVCGFERPPFVGTFTFKNSSGTDYRTIRFFGLHAKPDHAYQELQLLGQIYSSNKSTYNVLLGDFNADCDYLSAEEENYLSLKSLSWLIPRGSDTNTSSSSSCAYDRIVQDSAGLTSAGISTASASISDHYVVYSSLSDMKIAALNTQRYGPTKASDATTTATLKSIISAYDLILLQEITSSDLGVLTPITPSGYSYVSSDELGTTSYKERYVYMYKDSRVTLNSAQSMDTTACIEAYAPPTPTPTPSNNTPPGCYPTRGTCGSNVYWTGAQCRALYGSENVRVVDCCCGR